MLFDGGRYVLNTYLPLCNLKKAVWGIEGKNGRKER